MVTNEAMTTINAGIRTLLGIKFLMSEIAIFERMSTAIGAVREILGSGAIFGVTFASDVMPLLFILAPGGFLVLGYLMVVFNKIAKR